MTSEQATKKLSGTLVSKLKSKPFDGSMWIHPRSLNRHDLFNCAAAYAAAVEGKVTIEKQSNHSVVRLVSPFTDVKS